MKKENLYEAIGEIDDNYINDAHQPAKKRTRAVWLKWGAMAACLCLVVGVAIRIGIGFVPNQATDIFRDGNLIEITAENELPAKYDGELLAFNLGFENYEFYYTTDGVAENTDDWYSLLASKNDTNGYVLLHCMFDAASKQNPGLDWKVDSVFTSDATQKKTINGVDVDIAENKNSLRYKYWHYAIFTFDDVVYDVRVQSNNPEYVYEVLNQLIVPGGVSAEEAFDIAVSYANWAHAPAESFGALNTDKLAISSIQHLPIYRFDTLKDLEQFKLFDDRFTFDHGYDEIPSFNDAVAKYDDAFFEENSLMLVYVAANSGSYRYGVNSVFCDGPSFCIHVEQTNNPEVVTDDMAGWFVTVAVPDSMVNNCTEFDADLNNTEN